MTETDYESYTRLIDTLNDLAMIFNQSDQDSVPISRSQYEILTNGLATLTSSVKQHAQNLNLTLALLGHTR